jgi:hypothetical protein
VAPHRTAPLVFVVDLGLGPQGLFELVGPNQRRRTPDIVDLHDLLRDIHPLLLGHLLFERDMGKTVASFSGPMGFRVSGSSGGLHAAGDIGHHIIPPGRHLIFTQNDLLHDFSFLENDGFVKSQKPRNCVSPKQWVTKLEMLFSRLFTRTKKMVD